METTIWKLLNYIRVVCFGPHREHHETGSGKGPYRARALQLYHHLSVVD